MGMGSTMGGDQFWAIGRGSKLAHDFRLPILSCVALYVPLIQLIQSFMRNRKPLRLRLITIVANIVMAAFALAGLIVMLSDDWRAYCHVGWDESVFAPRTRMVLCLFCLCQSAQLLDSALLAFKKKKIDFHHFYHHLTSIVFCWHAQYMKMSFIHLFVLCHLIQHGIKSFNVVLKLVAPNNKAVLSFSKFSSLLQIFQSILLISISTVAMQKPDIAASKPLWWNAQMATIIHFAYAFGSVTTYIEKYQQHLRPAMTTFLGTFHVFALIGIYRLYHHPESFTLLFKVMGLYIIGGFGITCGAHRLWSHRAYKANSVFRFILFMFNSLANQGTIYRWSRDHRSHHKYSEMDGDPHDARRGFFYSHMGWLLLKKPDHVVQGGNTLDCSDLLEDGYVRFQMRFDPYWNQSISFLLPAVYGYFRYGDFWLGFFALGALRWCICLHATWTVNSVAHLWGPKPYNPNIWPAENWVTVLVAVGEGWHNWHHQYPFDYATSEGGIFSQWNPSLALIDLAAAFGMVWDRKRATGMWEKARERMALEADHQARMYELAKEGDMKEMENFASHPKPVAKTVHEDSHLRLRPILARGN